MCSNQVTYGDILDYGFRRHRIDLADGQFTDGPTGTPACGTRSVSRYNGRQDVPGRRGLRRFFYLRVEVTRCRACFTNDVNHVTYYPEWGAFGRWLIPVKSALGRGPGRLLYRAREQGMMMTLRRN